MMVKLIDYLVKPVEINACLAPFLYHREGDKDLFEITNLKMLNNFHLISLLPS